MDEQELKEMMGQRPKDSSRLPLINGDVSEVESSYFSTIKNEVKTLNKISTSSKGRKN